MKREVKYEILFDGIENTSKAPIDKDIFYQCKICGGIILSMPKDSIGCECGKIFIDKAMHRLYVENYNKILVLRKISSKKA